MPGGSCYFWTPSLIALHAVSDTIIVLAFYSIPVALIYFGRRRKDLKIHWMFVCFAVFILACGTTHLMDIWNIWHANYWLSGCIKVIAAAASAPTAMLLIKFIPQAIAIPNPNALQEAYNELELRVQERTAEISRTARDLENEIAERRRTEKQLKASLKEISDLKATLYEHAMDLEQRVIKRTAELEVANKELEAFSYSVSHDLRAPLRAVNGFAGIVLEDFGSRLPEEGRRYLERIREGGKRMGVLIDDLLEFSRLSRQPVNRRTVDTVEVLQNVLEESKSQHDGREIEWRIGELPVCEADPVLLKQVWVNLLSNAIKYTRDRNPAIVEIGHAQENGESVYFVRDNGTGFDMQYANKLFGVFQRLHRSDEFEGTGVGLAIVQRIVHRHGGRVWAEAAVDHGATFHFTLQGRNHT
jgi:light-regulated signal transduction histidine kinase (bacteriophytochrome)